MKAVREYFVDLWRTVYSIWEGMSVTLSYFERRPTTIQYPEPGGMPLGKPLEETLPERFRGILEIDLDICSGCLTCSRTCPIDCIAVEMAKDAEGQRFLTRFDVDISKCMFCGLCVEECKTGALRHSPIFAAAMADPYNLVLRYITTPVKPYKQVKGVESKSEKPRGSIAREVLARWDSCRDDVSPDARHRPVLPSWSFGGDRAPAPAGEARAPAAVPEIGKEGSDA